MEKNFVGNGLLECQKYPETDLKDCGGGSAKELKPTFNTAKDLVETGRCSVEHDIGL